MILESAAMNEFQYAWFLVFFLEVVVFFWLFEPLMHLSAKKKVSNTILIILWTLVYLLAKWQLEGYIFLNILTMICMGTVGLMIFSDRPFVTAVWLASVFTVCIELGRILVYGPIYIIGNHDFYLKYIWQLRVLGQILKTIFAAFCRKKICEYSKYRIHWLNWALIDLAIVQLIFMHYRRMVSAQNLVNIRIEMETFVILGSGVLSLLIIMIYNIKAFLQKKEIDVIRHAMDVNYQQVQMKSNTDAEIRRIYHDLKQQVAAMDFSEATQAQKEKKELTKKLSEKVSDLEMVSGTGSSLLDSLLNHKMLEAKKRHIHLELFVENVNYDFIDAMDLCSIVGNAIDNACEASEKIPQVDKRWIQVKAAAVQGIWVFKIENTCMEMPVIENHVYISSKPGDRREGIGIRSIQYCVQKYDGNVDIQMQDNRFALRVTMPIIA